MASAYNARNLPLDSESRWIRVFDLQPACFGRKNEPVRGRLRVVCLDDNPSYSALSYAWGNPLPSCQIAFGADESLSVTTNCYDALQQLRHSVRTRTLWVDSICVNQSNEEEKSHEVSLMQDIYNQAEKVYIWLGKGNQHSNYAMDWIADATANLSPLAAAQIAAFPECLRLSELSRMLRIALEHARIGGSIIPQMLLLKPIDQAQIAIYHRRPQGLKASYDREAMKDLISRDWFKRVWTIQELVMAREPIVVCGSKSMRWNNLHWGIYSAKSLADDEDVAALSEVFDSVLVTQSFWLDHYILSEWSKAPIRKWLLRGESSTFLERFFDFMDSYGWKLAEAQIFFIVLAILIRMYYGLRPLNSRGLLLAILSTIATLVLTPTEVMTGTEQRVRRGLVHLLHKTRTRQATKEVDRVFALHGILQKLGIPLQKPNYGKSVDQVYCEFTRAIISWSKSLDILTEASTLGLPDTPSWVPDWSKRYYSIFTGDFSAAKDSNPRYTFSDCGRKLNSSGVLVDTVVYCTEILEVPSECLFSHGRASIDSTFFTQYLRNIRVLTQWMSYAHQMSNQSHELFSEALFETIHSETDFETKDKSYLRQTFNKWYAILTADFSECSTICPSEIACALVLSTNESLSRYHRERCRAISRERIFFVTLHGYIGTGPPFMKITDKVAVLSGLHSPLILREAGLHHELVGAAYVHGIMEGEIWSEDETNLLQLTLI